MNFFKNEFFEILEKIKKIGQEISFKFSTVGDPIDRYQLHKISELRKDEISSIIRGFSKIDGRFVNLKIKKIGGTCYHIYEKK